MNILYIIFLAIFTIFYIFYILNKYILDKSYELFNTTSSGLLCGTDNNVCRINQYGTSSCCDGYTCMRKEGNFQFKVCIDNNKLPGSSKEINLSNLQNKLSIANIDGIDGKGGKYNKYKLSKYSEHSKYSKYHSEHNIPKSPTSPDLDENLYIFDDEIINNIIDYLNKLNMKDNLLIFNLKEYLYGLLLTSEEHNYDFNDLYLYINNLDLNGIDINILINIKNYLDGLNMPSNSINIELKNYLNGLNLPNNLDLNHQINDYILLNSYVINNILNYLNTLNLSNDSVYVKLKNDLKKLEKMIELNFKNNIDIAKINYHLETIKTFKLDDKMTSVDFKKFVNSLNSHGKQNIIDLKNYINGLNLKDYKTIGELKINLNNKINSLNNEYMPYFKNNTSLMQDLNIQESSNLSYVINIKKYLNALKISNDIVLSKLSNTLNSVNLSKVNVRIGNLDIMEQGLDIFGKYLKDLELDLDLSVCKN